MACVARTAAAVVLLLALAGTVAAYSVEMGPEAAAKHGWARGDVVPAEAMATFRVELRQPASGLAKLEELFYAVSTPSNPLYGKHLTVAEIADLVAAAPEHLALAHEWVLSAVDSEATVEVSPTRDYLFVTTTAGAVGRAFGAPLFTFSRPAARAGPKPHLTTVQRTVEAIAVPAVLSEAVEAIKGVADFPPAISVGKQPGRAEFQGEKVTPAVIYNQYDLKFTDPRLKPSACTQAVAEFEQAYFYPTDLASFQKDFKLKVQPLAKIVGKNDPSTGYLGECSLDVEYISASAQGAPTWMWSIGPFDLVQWAQAVLGTSNPPLVHSVSWGSDEGGFDGSTLDRTNTEFMKMGAAGMSVIVASGDVGTGSTGFFSCGKFSPQFPASAPAATAVGGTYVTSNTSAEIGWDDSGGGFSNHFKRPGYQEKLVAKYLASPNLPSQQYWNSSGRAIPDVSALSTNFQVLISNYLGELSGTSAATPTFAAEITMINGARIAAGKSPLGFLNPLLYAHGIIGQDIVAGNNKVSACPAGFPAIEGYDCVTGLGTPNFPQLLNAFA